MRKALYASVIAAFGLLVVAAPAQADEEFDVQVTGSTVKVVTKGAWHVNKDYPWKLKSGDNVVADKAKFELADKQAVIAAAPKGDTTLKGGVCSGDKCKSFEVKVTVK